MGLNNEPFISNEEIEQSTINLLEDFKQFCMLSPVLFLQLSFSENGLFTRRRKRKKLQTRNIVLRYKKLNSTASR